MHKPHLRYKDQTPSERTWTIHFISVTKVIKGLILVVVGIKLLYLIDRDVSAWATDFVTRHGIDLANNYVQTALDKLAGVGNRQLMQMSGVAFGYSCLLFTEGVGLWLQKRWAEWLTAIATALFIPIELYEIYQRFTWVRIGILVLNGFIVWYLVTRLKDEKVEDFVRGFAKTRRADPIIKICGITNVEDALLAVKFGADQLGFNFYDKSPRYVSEESARSIIEKLPEGVGVVGVFVNETVENIVRVSRDAKLDAIQLHGDEDATTVHQVHSQTGLDVIKAIRVGPDFDIEKVRAYAAQGILLDSYSVKERGGTGKTFDWKLAKELEFEVGVPIYLAGGLSAENVAEAIRQVRPFGVDACSSLESTPGKKDPVKLERFIAAIRHAI